VVALFDFTGFAFAIGTGFFLISSKKGWSRAWSAVMR
jgi:hypothetical protein